MRGQRFLGGSVGATVILLGGLMALAQTKPAVHDYEKKVKEADVPKAALEALKKLANGAAITEFAEEVEHGHKYYEGSWKGADGNVDGLVTEGGDVVELEEAIATDKVPATVRTAAEKDAGKDTAMKWEKKTVVMYEAHYKKDGKGREIILLPDGRIFHEEGEKAGEKKGEEDDDKDDE